MILSEKRRHAKAEAIREKVREDVFFWKQVPFLTSLLHGCMSRSGTVYGLAREGWNVCRVEQGSLFVHCTTGEIYLEPVDPEESGSGEVPDRLLLGVDRFLRHEDPWNGEATARGLAEELLWIRDRPLWAATVKRLRIGLTAGWEEETGALHAVSEAVVSLSEGWQGRAFDLVNAAVLLSGATGDPDVERLMVRKAHWM